MRRVTFHLDLTTAAFLHGAGGNAELRATAFKGAARYWFRAAFGAISSLREIEGRVFGSTDPGIGSRLSVVCLGQYRIRQGYLLPHRLEKTYGDTRQNKAAPSNCIEPSTGSLKLVMTARPSIEKKDFEAGVSAAWIALHLGGVGQRCRRGAGSFELKEVSEEGAVSVPKPIGACDSVDDYAAALAEQLSEAVKSIRTLAGPRQVPANADFPTLGRGCQIAVVALEKAKSEQDARRAVMEGLHKFKNRAFGLPYLRPANGDKPVGGRHASPLWIRIVKLKSDKFAAVETLLAGPIPKGGDRGRLEAYMRRPIARAEVRLEGC